MEEENTAYGRKKRKRGTGMKEKDFAVKVDSCGVNMGYIPGSKKILFIKTGQGGSIYGYENKYLDLAQMFNERYGFSVFVSATVEDSKEAFDRDMLVLDKVFANQSYQIYYLGVSKGGLIGMWHGSENEKIARVVTINAPLMINYHNKTRPAIDRLGDKLWMVVGSLDPSYDYTPFLKGCANVKILNGADHNLVGSKESLFDIAEELFGLGG